MVPLLGVYFVANTAVILIAIRQKADGRYWRRERMQSLARAYSIPIVRTLPTLVGITAQEAYEKVKHNWQITGTSGRRRRRGHSSTYDGQWGGRRQRSRR